MSHGAPWAHIAAGCPPYLRHPHRRHPVVLGLQRLRPARHRQPHRARPCPGRSPPRRRAAGPASPPASPHLRHPHRRHPVVLGLKPPGQLGIGGDTGQDLPRQVTTPARGRLGQRHRRLRPHLRHPHRRHPVVLGRQRLRPARHRQPARTRTCRGRSPPRRRRAGPAPPPARPHLRHPHRRHPVVLGRQPLRPARHRQPQQPGPAPAGHHPGAGRLGQRHRRLQPHLRHPHRRHPVVLGLEPLRPARHRQPHRPGPAPAGHHPGTRRLGQRHRRRRAHLRHPHRRHPVVLGRQRSASSASAAHRPDLPRQVTTPAPGGWASSPPATTTPAPPAPAAPCGAGARTSSASSASAMTPTSTCRSRSPAPSRRGHRHHPPAPPPTPPAGHAGCTRQRAGHHSCGGQRERPGGPAADRHPTVNV